VVFISFDEVDTKCAGDCRADQALAGSGDAHHDIKTLIHDIHVPTVCGKGG